MSISDTRLLEFAKYMQSNDDVIESIGERIDKKLMARFRKGTIGERQIISDLMDADSMFMKEVAVILAENDTIEINE